MMDFQLCRAPVDTIPDSHISAIKMSPTKTSEKWPLRMDLQQTQAGKIMQIGLPSSDRGIASVNNDLISLSFRGLGNMS